MQWPLIVLGMHRSGTSLVSRIVSDLGVFMGRRQEVNAESRAFLALNKWLLVQAGASWDYPDPLKDLLGDFHCRELAGRFCQNALKGKAGYSYLGALRWMTTRTPEKLSRAWGWKDPRNTLTLPIWQDLWPKARIIHVLRHGLDVAASLNHRHQERLARTERKVESTRWRWRASKRWLDASRVATVPGAMSLWEYYALRGRQAVKKAGELGLEIRYEDLLRQPDIEMARLSRWLGLPHTEKQLLALKKTLDPGRAEAWRRQKSLVQRSSDYAGLLSDFGYLAAD